MISVFSRLTSTRSGDPPTMTQTTRSLTPRRPPIPRVSRLGFFSITFTRAGPRNRPLSFTVHFYAYKGGGGHIAVQSPITTHAEGPAPHFSFFGRAFEFSWRSRFLNPFLWIFFAFYIQVLPCLGLSAGWDLAVSGCFFLNRRVTYSLSYFFSDVLINYSKSKVI